MKTFLVRGLLGLVGAVIGGVLGFFAVGSLYVIVSVVGMFTRIDSEWWHSFFSVAWPLGPFVGALVMAWPLVSWHRRHSLAAKLRGAGSTRTWTRG